MSEHVARSFVERLNKNNDILSNIVTINVFCESAINKLIEGKALKVKVFDNKRNKEKNSTEEIPIRTSSYSVKLYFAYSLDLIEQELYENLRLLNHWRNRVAHNIQVDIYSLQMGYHKFYESEKQVSKDLSEKELIRAVSYSTYIKLYEVTTEQWNIKL